MIRSVLILLGLAVGVEAADRAQRYFEAGKRAEKAGDSLGAYSLYSQAASLKPSNSAYAASRAGLQVRAALVGESLPEAVKRSATTADLVAMGELSPSEAAEARAATLPATLNLSREKKSFDLKGDPRSVIEQVAAGYGIQVAFENDYQNPPPFAFHVEDLSGQDALRALETVAGSFFVPINGKLMLVLRETPQKRTDSAAAMAMAIPIPERISVQEAQEIITAVQQTMEIRRVSVDPGRHLVVMRDQASKLLAARTLFAMLSRGRAQVSIEVQFVSVTKGSSLAYGLSTPTSSPIINFGSVPQTVMGAMTSGMQFLTFGGGATFLGFGVANVQVLAALTRSTSSSILTSQLVSADGQAASMHVGDRYPIITSGFFGGNTGTGQLAPAPIVNFQDLGLVLKVTPTVHGGGEVSLEVEAEYNVLGSESFNGIPVISRRKYTGKVRLKEGEAAVIAGLTKTSVAEARTGLAGVDSIPFIGKFLRKNSIEKEDTQILLVLTPQLTRSGPWEDPSPAMWVGTDSRPLSVF